MQVRGQVALTVVQALQAADDEAVERVGLQALLKIAGRFVSDNTSEAREAARAMLVHVRRARGGEEWEGFVKEVLPSTEALAVMKLQC